MTALTQSPAKSAPLADKDAAAKHPACLAVDGHHRCEFCHIRHQSICAALDLQELMEFANLSRASCYAPRATLMAESEPSANVFNLTQGMVRLSKSLPDGRRQIIGFAIPGDFLGLDLEGQYSFTAVAVDHASACRFPRKVFMEALQEKPALMARLHAITAHELTLAQEHMVILGRRSAEEKLAAFITGLRTRLSRISHVGAHVPLAMSRQDIADYLGLTIETVSRTFGKLAKAKVLVVTPDGVRILDEARLKHLATA
ncbi:MAG: Crp/Fnr family transcriptional regulator [Beijerinckiaceae bacterium]